MLLHCKIKQLNWHLQDVSGLDVAQHAASRQPSSVLPNKVSNLTVKAIRCCVVFLCQRADILRRVRDLRVTGESYLTLIIWGSKFKKIETPIWEGMYLHGHDPGFGVKSSRSAPCRWALSLVRANLCQRLVFHFVSVRNLLTTAAGSQGQSISYLRNVGWVRCTIERLFNSATGAVDSVSGSSVSVFEHQALHRSWNNQNSI